MNSEQILYLIPYLISLALSAGIFLYAWRHRQVRGARAYAWFVGGQTLYILGFIFELISPDLGGKIFWDKTQWVTEAIVVVIAFMVFAINFSETRFRRPKVAWGIILFFPIAFVALLATDGFHHLIYPNPHLVAPNPFSQLDYDFTGVVYIYSLSIYATTFYGIGLLARRSFQRNNVFRWQFAAIALGFSIPIVFTLLTLFNLIQIFGDRDIGPFTFGIGNLITAYALFRFRLFDLVPIARDTIVENMVDPVVVLDLENRVIDLNPAALATIGVTAESAIGQPSDAVFSAWPDLITRFRKVNQEKAQISLALGERQQYLEIAISPLKDRRGNVVGRVFIIHDITEHTDLAQSLQQLNNELEQRVRKRTIALQDALRQERETRFQLMQSERLAIAGRLLASVSHELNNPLQAIHNAVFLMKNELSLSDQGRMDMDIVLVETDRMVALLDRLRLVYKPIRNTDFELLQINALIEDIHILISTHLRHKQIVFDFQPEPDLPTISGIPDQLKQVLLNLFLNAVEEMPVKGRLLIQTETLSQQNEIMVRVKDTGPGIDPELLPQIFDAFVTDKETGTGLGLTISRDIIEQHSGRIQAENGPDGGAIFTIWLPIKHVGVPENS